MAKMEKLEDILTAPIKLTETVRCLAAEAGSFRNERVDLTRWAEKLGNLLRAVARLDGATGMHLYTRPLRRMIQELEKSLGKALVLVHKCSRKGMIKRVITITSAHDFRRVNNLLENSVGDISWFLSISAVGDNRVDGIGGMPPITSNEPFLGFCWEQIGFLCRGSAEEKNDAVISLHGYAKNNERFMKIMVEEEAIPPLLRVLQDDGTLEARETTARMLGHMAKDENVVKEMVNCGVVAVSVKVLGNGPMKVQAAMAWAVAEMLHSDPSQQDLFLEEQVVRPLVALLGESLEDIQKANPAVNMHTLLTSMAASNVGASTSQPEQDMARVSKPSGSSTVHFRGENVSRSQVAPLRPLPFSPEPSNRNTKPPDDGKGLSQRELYRRERENADPELKAELKAEAARALLELAKGNLKTCKSITETRALLCFATLMERARGAVQLLSVLAVMEIAAVAEQEEKLKRSAFKTSSPAAKAVVDQLLRLVEEGSLELQVPCIRAIGFLSRTFSVRETRVVKPLVKHLEGSEEAVAAAVAALVKFACKQNFLHKEHAKAVVDAGGAGPLVHLIFFARGEVQVDAVTLMCYLALHSGECEALARVEPLPALKKFSTKARDPELDNLVRQAINHLEIHHGRAPNNLAADDGWA